MHRYKRMEVEFGEAGMAENFFGQAERAQAAPVKRARAQWIYADAALGRKGAMFRLAMAKNGFWRN